ncbi:MAG: hypothetical protein J5601_06155, partial [Elusimicrobiaceae bacterium]|nr:hypothetical protein [Elusimicrobiaceae bacterium]
NKAMAYARKMVMELGMSEKLGPISLPSSEEGEVFLGRDLSRHTTYSQELAKAIDEEIMSLIRSSYERAKEIITANRGAFDKLVAALLEKEVVEAEEIDVILGLKPAEEKAKKEEPEQPVAPQKEESKKPQPEIQQTDLFGGASL